MQILQNADISSYQSSLPTAAEGTCKWIFDHPQYVSWRRETSSALLWISGDPGSGKTILSSFVAETFRNSQRKTKHDPIICCFFCNEDLASQNDALGILRSMIFQILLERRALFEHAISALDRAHGQAHLLESFTRLWELFQDMACDKRLGPLYIVIDALDECKKTLRQRLLENIAALIEKLKAAGTQVVKFFLTSRPNVGIGDHFTQTLFRQIPLEESQTEINQDISLVIAQRVDRIAKRLHAKQAMVELMQSSLLKGAGRTFLWVRFVLELMDEELCATPDDFVRILNDLPPDLETMYGKLLNRIPRAHHKGAMDVLQAIIVSPRPLLCEELNIIWTISKAHAGDIHDTSALTSSQYWSVDIQHDLRIMLGSLVRISENAVYLVHLSLKEFLCTTILQGDYEKLVPLYHVDIGQANRLMANVCADYLSFEDFDSIYSSSKDTSSVEESSNPIPSNESSPDELSLSEGFNLFGTSLFKEEEEIVLDECSQLAQRFKLYDYSSRNWAKHCALGQGLFSEEEEAKFLHLLDKDASPNFEKWFKYYWLTSEPEHSLPLNRSTLVVVCYFGNAALLKRIIGDAAGNHDEFCTALYWAARQGHAPVVQVLLRTKVTPKTETLAYQTPLCVAAASGHLEVVRCLALDDRVDVNFRGEESMTPLSQAANAGHLSVVEFLLGHRDVDPRAASRRKWTCLFYAISSRNEHVVRVLLEDPRVDNEHIDIDGASVLIRAVIEGKIEIVRLLKRKSGVDTDLSDKKGCTAFLWAARLGHLEILRELRKCKSVASKDIEGRNAYSWAASGGHVSVIENMKKLNIGGIDEPDLNLWTPLFWALDSTNFDSMVSFMKSKAVDINHKDWSGRTVLDWSGTYGKEEALRSWLKAHKLDASVNGF